MQYDLVTVGGGFSGLTTACRAAELGLKAAVLEARRGGPLPLQLALYDRRLQRHGACRSCRTPDVLYRGHHDGSGADARSPSWRARVADNGKRADRLARAAGRAVHPARAAEGSARPEGAGAAAAADGRARLGRARRRRADAAAGGESDGSAAACSCAAPRSTSLVVEGGACVGVEAVQDGKPVRIAARAVVDRRRRLRGQSATWSRNTSRRARIACSRRVGPGAKGDGIRMARGGRRGDRRTSASSTATSITRNAMTNARLWPYPHLDAVAEVGDSGRARRRALHRRRASAACARPMRIARLPDPLSAFLVIDDAMWQAEPKLTTTVAANPAMVTAGRRTDQRGRPRRARRARRPAAGRARADGARAQRGGAQGRVLAVSRSRAPSRSTSRCRSRRRRSTRCRSAPASPARWAAS